MIALERTLVVLFGSVCGSCNLRSVYLYVSIASSCRGNVLLDTSAIRMVNKTVVIIPSAPDQECESNLTYYTVTLQNALRDPGPPLPPLPRVGRVAQRHDNWDEHYVQPHGGNERRRHPAATAAEAPRRVTGVGIEPEFDIGGGPEEEEVLLSPRDPQARTGERSRSLGPPRRRRPSTPEGGMFSEDATTMGGRQRTSSEPPSSSKRGRRRQGHEPDPAVEQRGHTTPPRPARSECNRSSTNPTSGVGSARAAGGNAGSGAGSCTAGTILGRHRMPKSSRQSASHVGTTDSYTPTACGVGPAR